MDRLFAFLVTFLLLSPALSDPIVLLLHDDKKASQARFEVITQAQESLNIQYFIVGDDRTSLTGAALLRDAALRGVKVQLLVDAQFNSLPKPVVERLIDAGVRIKKYHPWSWRRPFRMLKRMHDKGISADGTVMIRGGRNIEKSYFGLDEGRNYTDLDVLIADDDESTSGERTTAIQDSEAYFNRLFNSSVVAEPKVTSDQALIDEGERLMNEAYQESKTLGTISFNSDWNWREEGIVVEDSLVSFLFDPVGNKNNGNGIAPKLGEIFLAATEEILISSPYFVPTKEFFEHVETLRARRPNIPIIVVTNSVVSTDGYLPQGGYIRYRRKLIEQGIKIYEYKGPSSLHAKAMVTGDLSVVTSFNLDPRSQKLNTEIGVTIEDPSVANEVRNFIHSQIQNSWEIGPNGLPINGINPMDLLTQKQKLKVRAAICASYLIKGQL